MHYLNWTVTRPRLWASSMLGGAALLAAPAAMAQSAGSPADAIREAKARVDREADRVSATIDTETGRLTSFVVKADVATDKAMDLIGIQAKARLEQSIAALIDTARRAVPADARLNPAWQPGATSACSQGGGKPAVKTGGAACTAGTLGQSFARSQGDGSNAAATSVAEGKATARALGAGSTATAKSGDPTRTGQRGNIADAISTDGSSATASAGLGEADQLNKTTAVADGGSLSTADATSGNRNLAFAGAFNKGEARATNRVGDRNVAIAFGANGSNDGNLPGGSRATTLIGYDNVAVSVTDGPNSAATTNSGYGDRHRAYATAGPNANARADGAQGEDNFGYSQATDRAHALSYTSYGDKLVAITKARGDGSSGTCSPIGQGMGSGETTFPPDACATANARSVDGVSNTAIAIVDKAKANAIAERGARNTAVARARNGGDIIWNTTAAVTRPGTNAGPFPTAPQAPNPHEGMKADCPWPLPPLPQSQQPCGNATAKASYGDGNLAVAEPDGDHAFTWSEASGGSYNQTYATATGTRPQARARAVYNTYGTAKATARDGGKADSITVMGYRNLAVSNAIGSGSVADARAAGSNAKATATASAGGSALAIHNTATTPAFLGVTLKTEVKCSSNSVAYAMIGSGQTCGNGF